MNNNKLIIIAIAAGVLILVSLIWISNAINNRPPTSSVTPTPIPVVTVTRNSYKHIEAAPTLEPFRGAGVDIKSQAVQESTAEIQKLSAHLPFNKDIVSSNGQTITIQIPELKYQTSTWVLTAYIYGIDYNVPVNTPEYTENKALFLQAAGEMFGWMSSNTIDPKKIIIQWDDKAFIQNRAEEWLQ